MIKNLRKSLAYRAFVRNKAGLSGAVVVSLIVIFAIFAPIMAPYDPSRQDIPNRLAKPSFEHLLGTDQYGRDVLSRLIYGARVSLMVGVASVFMGALLGVILGVIAGYSGRMVDLVICKVIDILMSFPMLLLAMAIIAMLGTGLVNSIVAVGIASIPRFARLARGQALSLKSREYIEAVKALGASPLRIIFFHLLPNLISPIIVMGTLYLATAIITEANLSFLGLGVQPPTATWGAMISDGKAFLRSSPWVSVFPGLAIAVSVLGFNMFGDGLRDALDPRLQKEE